MSRLITFLAIMLAFALNIHADEIDTTIVSNNHYGLKVGEFSELKVVDGVNVVYHCDASRAGSIEFTAEKDVASAVIFDCNKGKLSIMLASRTEPYRSLPTVHVYSSYLTKVSNEGDSLLSIRTIAPGAKFSCKVMGNGSIHARDVKFTDVSASVVAGHGSIVISGEATTLSLSVAGAGKITAVDMPANEISCRSAGTGIIECNPLKLLTVSGLGGAVRYRGMPEIRKKFLSQLTLQAIDFIDKD